MSLFPLAIPDLRCTTGVLHRVRDDGDTQMRSHCSTPHGFEETS